MPLLYAFSILTMISEDIACPTVGSNRVGRKSL